ncbi:hypothetical protein N7535_001410 [Penicillium sp. DV-2018c]|nr:hypothetical protein N7461_005342 [Penicillium sp. DV-2018c]KAJ5582790.1 hypothetical protein N7535_001410 [Penicillium sp. DV-2018c]
MSIPKPLKLEPHALYILLLDLGNNSAFNWQLYLAATVTTGRTFHITNEAGPIAWECKSEAVNDIGSSSRLVLALQVGVVEPVLHAALARRLALVPLALYSVRFWEELCCRVWVQEALYALDDEGYLGLGSSVRDIEREARRLGVFNKSRGVRSVVRSKACIE